MALFYEEISIKLFILLTFYGRPKQIRNVYLSAFLNDCEEKEPISAVIWYFGQMSFPLPCQSAVTDRT